jgi:hypothetical protein
MLSFQCSSFRYINFTIHKNVCPFAVQSSVAAIDQTITNINYQEKSTRRTILPTAECFYKAPKGIRPSFSGRFRRVEGTNH